jgi:hypothetical protein
MECDDNRFYDEKYNFLFVKTEGDGRKLLDHIFIHKEIESGKGFIAHFKSYDEDLPLEVYSLNKISLTQLNGVDDVDNSLYQLNCSDLISWKRLRIKPVLPTVWKIHFEKIMSIVNSGNTQ